MGVSYLISVFFFSEHTMRPACTVVSVEHLL